MSTRNRRQLLQSGAALAAAAALGPRAAALAQSATPAASPAATPVLPADIATPPLRNKGKLTVHTDQPAYPPFFIDNDPANGKGFESGVVYAVADKLGFKKEDVDWGYTSFNASYAPGPKPFDFYVAQVSITDERKKAVDFSDPYYKSPLVVVAKEDSPVQQAKTMADLAKFVFGAQVGTLYYIVVVDNIKPEKDPLVFDTTDNSLTALKNGQVDAVVLDMETANYVTSEQVKGTKIVGMLPVNPGQGSGLVFEKGSKLVPYVNAAIGAMIADGTRDKLIKEWLAPPADLITFS